MADPVFPTLPSGNKLDSKKFDYELEDPSMTTEMEGGYVVSRARHTRTPRKTWRCGFTYIDNADRAVVENFWNQVRGRSVVFVWMNPQDNVEYRVRFKEKMSFTYVGQGSNQRWDVSFSLEQA